MTKCYESATLFRKTQRNDMAKNPRIHITVDAETAKLLNNLADQENKSLSSLATELILDSLERREDMALSMLAEHRDRRSEKKVKHADAWK